MDLGCGSGAAADYFASRRNIDITCVTNSSAQGDICRSKFEKYGGRLRVMVADFDGLSLPEGSFDAHLRVRIDRLFQGRRCLAGALLADVQAGRAPAHPLARVTGLLSPEKDFQSVTAFFENWRYNFLGANMLVFKLRRLGFVPIRYRHLPFWAWGLTWNFIQHLVLWKYRLKMRTMVELEWIIWRTSKVFRVR